MRRRRSAAARFAERVTSQIIPKGLRVERTPGLRAVKLACHVRCNPTVCACHRRAARAPASRSHRVGDAKKSSPWKSVHRLEPECRSQNDGGRLLAAGKTTPAIRFGAGALG